MADLISRAAAIARIDKCVALSGIGLEPVMAVRDIKALISVLPAVDAIPVEWLNHIQTECVCDMVQAPMYVAIGWLVDMWQKEQEAQHG